MVENILIFLGVFLLFAVVIIALRLSKPCRPYAGPTSVSNVYDLWTNDPKIKSYWGNQLHAGYYGKPPTACSAAKNRPLPNAPGSLRLLYKTIR